MTDNDVPRERMEDKKDQIYEDLLNMITEEFGLSPTDVNPELDIREDLQFDSLQLYSFIINVEEAYDIRIADELIDQVHTMNDLVDMVSAVLSFAVTPLIYELRRFYLLSLRFLFPKSCKDGCPICFLLQIIGNSIHIGFSCYTGMVLLKLD